MCVCDLRCFAESVLLMPFNHVHTRLTRQLKLSRFINIRSEKVNVCCNPDFNHADIEKHLWLKLLRKTTKNYLNNIFTAIICFSHAILVLICYLCACAEDMNLFLCHHAW